MGRWNWPMICFFVALSGTTAVGVLLPPEERICSAMLLGKAAEQANTPIFGCLEFWLNRYQTLIAGLLAVLAALGSIYFLWRQIGLAEQQEADRFARRNAAARAMLQISASAICAYAKQSALAINELIDAIPARGVANWPVAAKHPAVPEAALQQIQTLIETLPESEINSYAELIGKIQVHSARMESLIDGEAASQYTVEGHLLDAAEIYARSSNMFAYARRTSDTTPTTIYWQNVWSALFVMRTGPDLDQEFQKRLERLYPSNGEKAD